MHNAKPSLSFGFSLCVYRSLYTTIVVYILDRTHPFCVIGQNISFWQHLYFLRTVIKPESEQGFCCWNHCHCFSITTLPNAHSSGLQSLWSLLELVPAEWTDWWVGGGVCVCVGGCVRVCVCVVVCVRLWTKGCVYVACFWISCVFYRLWADCGMSSVKHKAEPVSVIQQIK